MIVKKHQAARIVRWSVGLVVVSLPVMTHSLELGRLFLDSTLGQPLRARLDLSSVTPDELRTLTVSLASPEVLRGLGLDVEASLPDVRFLVKTEGSRHSIRIIGHTPVREPSVTILADIRWDGGRILREIPILLDPPTEVVSNEESSQVINGSSEDSENFYSRKRNSDQNAIESIPIGDERYQYIAQDGDTLRKIAERKRSKEISISRVLMALKSLNSNISSLASIPEGTAIIIPSRDDLLSSKGSRGRAEIAQQNARSIVNQPDVVQSSSVKGLIAQTKRAAPRKAHTNRVQVAKANVEGSASSGSKKTSTVEDAAVLQKEQELSAHVLRLESRIASLERLLEIKSKAMASLNENVRASSVAQAPLPPSMPGQPLPGSASNELGASSSSNTSSQHQPVMPNQENLGRQPSSGVSSSGVSSSGERSQSVKSIPLTKVQPSASFLDRVMSKLLDNLLWVVGGFASLMAGFVVIRRIRANKDVGDEVFEGDESIDLYKASDVSKLSSSVKDVVEAENKVSQAAVHEPTEKKSVVSQIVPSRVAETAKVVPSPSASSNDVFNEEKFEAPLADIDTDELDVVSEAEVYIGYGRDEQAEEILLLAIERHGKKPEVILKLLEIYSRRGDSSLFNKWASSLKEIVSEDSPEWNKACRMGIVIDPDNSLYKQVSIIEGMPLVRSVNTESVDEEFTFMDLGFELDNKPPVDSPVFGAMQSQSDSSQFELTQSQSDSSQSDAIKFEPIGSDLTQEVSLLMDNDISLSEPEANTILLDQSEMLSYTPSNLSKSSQNFDEKDFNFAEVDLSLGDKNASLLEQGAGNDIGETDDLKKSLEQIELAKAYRDVGDTDRATQLLVPLLDNPDESIKTKALALLGSL